MPICRTAGRTKAVFSLARSDSDNPYIGATATTSDSLQAAKETALGRRVVYWSGLFVFSALAGLALVGVEPIFVFAGFLSILSAVLILYKPWWGLLLYTAIFMIRPGELWPILAPLRLEMIVGCLTLVGLAFQQYRREGRLVFDRTWQSRFLLLFIAAAVLSTPMSYWRSASVEGVMILFKILAFYIMVVQLVDTRLRFRIFFWTFLGLTIYGVASALWADTMFAQGIHRIQGVTSAAGSPNRIGANIAATFPILVLLLLYKPLGPWRLLLIASTGLLLYVLPVTGSRAGLLGFMIALLWLWWTSRRRIASAVVGMIALAILFATLPEEYQQRYATLTSSRIDASSRGRIDTWVDGLNMVVDRPLLGVGINSFRAAHDIRDGWALDAHNMYLQILAEVGLIGALPFLAFLFQLLVLNRRAARMLEKEPAWRFERLILQGLFAGLLAFLVTAMFGTQYINRLWYVYGALQLVIFRLYLATRQDAAAGA